MKANFLAATLALAGCSPLVGALLDDNHDGGTDAQPDTGNVFCEPPSDPCPDGFFCLFSSCEQTIGHCRQVPADCSDADALPVCGCDGVTYMNECELHRAGQSMQFVGECAGETCTSDNRMSCPGGYFCNGYCGESEGWCEPLPDGCVMESICGCDSIGNPVTYPSMCDMAANLGWFAYVGDCGVGSCLENDPEGVCGPGSFCEGMEGQCGSGLRGRCADRPATCEGVIDPVCGCDDVTYNNDCERQVAGVWLAHAGPCRTALPCTVDPSGLDSCGTMMFCETEIGVCPESADVMALGYCVSFDDCSAPPCPAGPVCGCDGSEYADDCARRQAGVNAACCNSCGEDCTTSPER
jgi:hypothetical protein